MEINIKGTSTTKYIITDTQQQMITLQQPQQLNQNLLYKFRRLSTDSLLCPVRKGIQSHMTLNCKGRRQKLNIYKKQNFLKYGMVVVI